MSNLTDIIKDVTDELVVLNKGMDFVTLEQFGEVGASAYDNNLLLAALNTGSTVLMLGNEYKFDQFEWTGAANIIIGNNTIIRNVQTSGAKKHALSFKGAGLVGAAVSVTHIGGQSGLHDHTTRLVDTITVSDPSAFSVGDTVKLSENAAFATETNVSAPTVQDYNSWDYRTILSIDGGDIQFEESIRLNFDTTRSLQLQKVEFLENFYIRGGKHVGGIRGGGGVLLDFCRRSTANEIIGSGISDLDTNGGEPLLVTNSWQCSGSNIGGWRGVFGVRFRFNQSCRFENLHAKRTTNGGVMLVSNIFSHFGPIVLDSAGDNNGDGLGLHSANKFNIIGPITFSGDRCYGAWIKQPSTDNTFLPIISSSGITACILNTGDRNTFQNITVKGNNGSGIGVEANNCTVSWLDYKGPGAGFRIRSGYTGLYIRGRSVSTGSDTFAWDGVLGAVTGCDIDIEGGARGLQYESANRNETNNIIVRGVNPDYYGRIFRGRGWSWATEILGVNSSTPKLFKIVGDVGDVGGLKPLVPPSGDNADAFLITLQTQATFNTAHSQYQLTGRQGLWFLTQIRKGTSSFAPALQINASNEIEILTSSATSLPIFALVEKF
jgi:hypothetical protein